MPKGPKGQKRPTDVMMRIATGEVAQDFPADDGKDKAAQSLGQRGGRARAKSLTKEQRTAIARKAARARWR
jgi:hypothetical protein